MLKLAVVGSCLRVLNLNASGLGVHRIYAASVRVMRCNKTQWVSLFLKKAPRRRNKEGTMHWRVSAGNITVAVGGFPMKKKLGAIIAIDLEWNVAWLRG